MTGLVRSLVDSLLSQPQFGKPGIIQPAQESWIATDNRRSGVGGGELHTSFLSLSFFWLIVPFLLQDSSGTWSVRNIVYNMSSRPPRLLSSNPGWVISLNGNRNRCKNRDNPKTVQKNLFGKSKTVRVRLIAWLTEWMNEGANSWLIHWNKNLPWRRRQSVWNLCSNALLLADLVPRKNVDGRYGHIHETIASRWLWLRSESPEGKEHLSGMTTMGKVWQKCHIHKSIR